METAECFFVIPFIPFLDLSHDVRKQTSAKLYFIAKQLTVARVNIIK